MEGQNCQVLVQSLIASVHLLPLVCIRTEAPCPHAACSHNGLGTVCLPPADACACQDRSGSDIELPVVWQFPGSSTARGPHSPTTLLNRFWYLLYNDSPVGTQFLRSHVAGRQKDIGVAVTSVTALVLRRDALDGVGCRMLPRRQRVKVGQQVLAIVRERIPSYGYVPHRDVLPGPVAALKGIAPDS